MGNMSTGGVAPGSIIWTQSSCGNEMLEYDPTLGMKGQLWGVSCHDII